MESIHDTECLLRLCCTIFEGRMTRESSCPTWLPPQSRDLIRYEDSYGRFASLIQSISPSPYSMILMNCSARFTGLQGRKNKARGEAPGKLAA